MKVNAVRVFLIALLISSPALADSSSPNLAAYYDRQMAIVGGQIYAWKGRNPPKAISVTAHQVGGGCQANANQSPKSPTTPSSCRQLTPLGQRGGAVLLEDGAAVEMAVEIEVVEGLSVY